ncbi:hypothetical protein [Lewinella sp. LCG006]|uniref:hypothetical protein n=1 Tax=Lewinella sp. LCG006 TaxID=3231911 RepID=UPI003460E943
MPTSTIPYDPSLVLGMVIAPEKIKQLQEIATLQSPVDNARNKVNALLRQKLSLDMTLQELSSLGASILQLAKIELNIQKIMDAIIAATTELSEAVMTSEEAIAALLSAQGQKQISSQVESPIDFSASTLTSLPISSDTMSMDVQYFRYEDNEESSQSTVRSASAFVGAKVSSFLGPKYGASAAADTKSSMDAARKERSLVGTVVVLINCTHKNAQVFSPVKLDVENAIENYATYTQKAWTTLSPDKMLEMAKLAIEPGNVDNAMPVLVGASYGSSLVGFVHFEHIEKTRSMQKARSDAAQISASIQTYFVEASIGAGAEASSNIKDLMSSSSIQSHCNVITMGLIPSIKSNTVVSVVEGMQDGPKERMEQLALINGANSSGMKSMATMASQAKTGQAVAEMKNDYIKGTVSAVGAIDKQNNQVIDMNSLMTAIDDFVERANKGEGGVPINFYIKYVTQRTIAQQWMEKYYPEMLYEKEDDEKSN